jgi:hypothetical protein
MSRNTNSGSAPVLIAAFFLIVPLIVALVVLCLCQHSDPAEDYARAVHDAIQPDSHVSHSLVSVSLDQPVTVVTWTRQKQVADYKNGTTPNYKNTWVTVAPWLKSFCQDYVRSHGRDLSQLNLRLEQRLGLPPNADYDAFVEVTIDPKDNSKFFRPCDDPSVNSNTCAAASLPEEIRDKIQAIDLKDGKENAKYWFLSKYYRSFAANDQYPWTALGYTFDWARAKDSSDEFVRWGESEFVVGPGTPAKFVSSADTLAYCTP